MFFPKNLPVAVMNDYNSDIKSSKVVSFLKVSLRFLSITNVKSRLGPINIVKKLYNAEECKHKLLMLSKL